MQTPEPRLLVNKGVRLDVEDLQEWDALLRLDDPEVNRSLEIRRLIRRDIADRKARENGRAA